MLISCHAHFTSCWFVVRHDFLSCWFEVRYDFMSHDLQSCTSSSFRHTASTILGRRVKRLPAFTLCHGHNLVLCLHICGSQWRFVVVRLRDLHTSPDFQSSFLFSVPHGPIPSRSWPNLKFSMKEVGWLSRATWGTVTSLRRVTQSWQSDLLLFLGVQAWSTCLRSIDPWLTHTVVFEFNLLLSTCEWLVPHMVMGCRGSGMPRMS
jgi:hypothetical protein